MKPRHPRWVQHLQVSDIFLTSGLPAACLVVVALSTAIACLTCEYLALDLDVGDSRPYPVLPCLIPATDDVGE